MRYLFIILLFFFTNLVLGSSLTGMVYDKTDGNTLPFANVIISGTTLGAATDKDGKFVIPNLKPGTYSVRASYSGYTTCLHTICISNDTTLNFYLEETNYDINTVVVTGTRTEKSLKDAPVLTQVISGKEMENIDAVNIEDALTMSMPSINFTNANQGLSMRMGGLEAKYIVFLIDGEKVAGETNGNINYNRLKTSDIERIEIVKGASGLLYGSNAMGGVINIITKKNQLPWEASIGSRFSKYNEKDFNANVGVNIGDFNIKSSLFTNSTDGFDVTPESEYEMTQEPYKSKSAKIKVGYKASDKLNFDMKGSYYDRERFDSDLIPMHNKDYDYTFNVKSNYFINTSNILSSSWHTDKYITKNVDEIYDDAETSISENTYSNFKVNGVFNFLSINTLNTGVEYITDNLYSNRLESEEENAESYVLFAQNEFNICSFFNIIAGVRTNYHSIYGFNTVPQISTMYKFYSMKLRAGYSRGYKSPTLKELYMNFSPVPIVEIHGNEDLIPESSEYYSLSLEYSKSYINTSVSVYKNKITNMITEIQDLSDPKIWTYQNISNVDVSGVDFLFRTKLKFGLAITGAYSYTNSEDKINGQQMLGTSKNNASLSFDHNFKRKNYNININLMSNYFGQIPFEEMDDITGEVVSKLYDEHMIWKLTTTTKLYSGISLTAGIDNIFDKAEINNILNINPGRRYFIGLKLHLHKLKFKNNYDKD